MRVKNTRRIGRFLSRRAQLRRLGDGPLRPGPPSARTHVIKPNVQQLPQAPLPQPFPPPPPPPPKARQPPQRPPPQPSPSPPPHPQPGVGTCSAKHCTCVHACSVKLHVRARRRGVWGGGLGAWGPPQKVAPGETLETKFALENGVRRLRRGGVGPPWISRKRRSFHRVDLLSFFSPSFFPFLPSFFLL